MAVFDNGSWMCDSHIDLRVLDEQEKLKDSCNHLHSFVTCYSILLLWNGHVRSFIPIRPDDEMRHWYPSWILGHEASSIVQWYSSSWRHAKIKHRKRICHSRVPRLTHLVPLLRCMGWYCPHMPHCKTCTTHQIKERKSSKINAKKNQDSKDSNDIHQHRHCFDIFMLHLHVQLW